MGSHNKGCVKEKQILKGSITVKSTIGSWTIIS
jgi:hypothetical protein